MTNALATTITSLVPKEEPTADMELQRIIEEYNVANIVREISRFRIWRLNKTGKWRSILNADGDIQYPTWEDFVIDIGDKLNCGRQQIFERVRVYEQLHWLGYSAEDSIRLVSTKPALYPRLFGMIMNWDQRAGEPREILIPNLNGTKDAKKIIRELIDDVNVFDTQADALKFVSESILVEPQVDFWFDGDKIHCVYYNQYIDSNGEVHLGDSGAVTYYPDKDMPAWAYEKFERMFKTLGKFRQEKTSQ